MVDPLKNTPPPRAEAPPMRDFVCGIDGSPESLLAARQAGLLAGAEGSLVLLCVTMPDLAGSVLSALPGGTAAAERAHRASDRATVDRAREAVTTTGTVVVKTRVGPPAAVLEAEAAQVGADAIAVGSHGNGRAAGILLGSVATRLIHAAACSVLIARAPVNGPADAGFPRSVAVGLDASTWSLAALTAGCLLAERLDVPLRTLHVSDGTRLTDALPAEFDGEVEVIRQHVSPADGLCSRVTAADLLVVGSRGAHGLRALGSVSEAVAHRSPASVLIVRPPRRDAHPG
jgi:nucleotide-binding universal stress UspA family protein